MKKFKDARTLCLIIAMTVMLSVLISGCAFEGVVYFEDDPEAMYIELNKSEVELREGRSTKLRAKISPKEYRKAPVTWESSDPDVVSVSDDGKVTAVMYDADVETVTIIAMTDFGQSAECIVTVTQPGGSKKRAADETSPEDGGELSLDPENDAQRVFSDEILLDDGSGILIRPENDNQVIITDGPKQSNPPKKSGAQQTLTEGAKQSSAPKNESQKVPAVGTTQSSPPKPAASVADSAIPADSIPISNRAELEDISYKDGNYHLTADIDLSGKEWEPISHFEGSFDGRGHSINGLYILSNSKTSWAGLFSDIQEGKTVIKNITVNIGKQGVAAWSENGAVSDAGGLIGLATGGTILNCTVIGTVSNSGGMSFTGGLIGLAEGTGKGGITIKNCRYTGDVSAKVNDERNSFAGGLIGSVRNYVTIENSYVAGSVFSSSKGTHDAGGLIGEVGFENKMLKIKNCYSTSNVSVTGEYVSVGGFIGSICGGITQVENCYASGIVSSSDETSIGGLIGHINWEETDKTKNKVTTKNNFRLEQNLKGRHVNESGTQLTSEQMRTASSFTGWDFNNTWKMESGKNSGYPVLRAFD